MVIIDDIEYDVPVVDIQRRAEFKDKYRLLTEGGSFERELIGVYFNYTLVIGIITDKAKYDALYDKLTEPVESHEVTVPDHDGNRTFTAFIDVVRDAIKKSKGGVNTWTGLSFDYIAKEPTRS
jgi:hypothetical protein